MALFEKLKNMFAFEEKRKTKILKHVYYNQDPSDAWGTLKELGDGAFGKVYLMRNQRTNNEAALKQVRIEDDPDIDDHAVEINILSELKHPNIVMLQETYFYDDKLWMFLEYCMGGAIDAIMMNLDRPLTESQISNLSLHVCRGLEFLHKNFIIHRDLKASNLLLAHHGVVKIADFGVSAKNEGETRGRNTFMGTPYWMAPEVVRCETMKDEPYYYKADIWSFGITLIECAQMNPPHHDMHPMRVLIKITKSEPPTLNRPNRWSKNFNDFLSRCLVKNPNQRCSAPQLLKHPFVSDLRNNDPLKQLLSEAMAEVTEEIKEEPDEASLEESESMEADTKSSSSSSSTNDVLSGSEDDEDRVLKMVMMAIVEEVIMCVNKKPSIPGVVFDTIMEIINDNDDDGADGCGADNDLGRDDKEHGVQEPARLIASASELNELCEYLYARILEDVLQSTNRQPSISGVVLDVMTDIIKGTQTNNTLKATEVTPIKIPKAVIKTQLENLPETVKPVVEKVEIRPGYKKTLTRTRKFINTDGQLVMTSTRYNISGDDLNSRQVKAHELRRRDMRDMKLQQKVEMKQLLELDNADKLKFEELANKHDRDKQAAMKILEVELEQVSRSGRVQIEKVDEEMNNEQKVREKKFKVEEDATIKGMLENHKKELKNLKLEPNDLQNGLSKKEALKFKKDATMMNQLEKERKLKDTLEQNLSMMKEKLKEEHRNKIAKEELKILHGRQQAIKKRENMMWRVEDELMKKRHELYKQHIRGKFILRRQHMMDRHNREIISLEESNKESLVELVRDQTLERRKQPRLDKLDSKVRCQTFKKKLKESGTVQTWEMEREKMNEFEENEKKLMKENMDQLEATHSRELLKLQTENQLKIKDLENIQKNKLKMLVEEENDALKRLDEQFNDEYLEWKERLSIKKNQLEESFMKEVNEHNNFYFGKVLNKSSVA